MRWKGHLTHKRGWKIYRKFLSEINSIFAHNNWQSLNPVTGKVEVWSQPDVVINSVIWNDDITSCSVVFTINWLDPTVTDDLFKQNLSSL